MTETTETTESAEPTEPARTTGAAESGVRASIDERIAAADSSSIWVGDQIHLRGYEPEDVGFETAYEENTIDQRRGWKAFPPRSSVARKAWNEEAAAAKPEGDAVEFRLAIARRSDNIIVGSTNPHGIDIVNGTFKFGISVAEEHKGHGYAGEAVLLLLRYMFDERRFQKCGSEAHDYNAPSIALHRKLGFVEEGRLRRNMFVGGGYHDTVLFGMTVEEFHELYPKLRPRL
jgi:RimJ/RimL family protein N-acetyltransferase